MLKVFVRCLTALILFASGTSAVMAKGYDIAVQSDPEDAEVYLNGLSLIHI